MKKQCNVCGNEFIARKFVGRKEEYQTCCSRECSSKRRKGMKYWSTNPVVVCKFCGSEAVASKLCSRHYQQISRVGKIMEYTHKDKATVIERGEYAEVLLRNRSYNIVGTAVIDTDDIHKAKLYTWHMSPDGYAKTTKTSDSIKTNLFLHHCVVGKKKGLEVDHINGNKMDNRKSNLRFVTHDENMKNYSRNRK